LAGTNAVGYSRPASSEEDEVISVDKPAWLFFTVALLLAAAGTMGLVYLVVGYVPSQAARLYGMGAVVPGSVEYALSLNRLFLRYLPRLLLVVLVSVVVGLAAFGAAMAWGPRGPVVRTTAIVLLALAAAEGCAGAIVLYGVRSAYATAGRENTAG
jgi:hypothetical protein